MRTYIIFSIDGAETPDFLPTGEPDLPAMEARTATVQKFVNTADNAGVQVVPLIGCWEGSTEISFLMQREQFDTLLASVDEVLTEQDSFLHLYVQDEYPGEGLKYLSNSGVHHRGPVSAELIWTDGRPGVRGIFRPVAEKEAKKHSGWTFRPDVNQHYLFEENLRG